MNEDRSSGDAPEDTRVGLIGKSLGRYRITAELGRGGMATVYRATDPELGRDVAVKVMHGTFAGRGDIEARFRREAQAVAAIKHDGIVAIFDFATPGGGEPGYIVTEIVEGPTLRALVDGHGGRLLPEIAVPIATRVAGALGAAHASGIVHRDVKPDNVMIDLGPRGARVLLTDFGVAHIVDADTMTASGTILGSPSYMSPEQARGQPVGPPSDVFSLGVLLYHLVTGRPPFGGSNPLTVIAAILRGELARPSQLDAHVGPALEAIILRCLKSNPAERYPEAGAVAAALEALWREMGLGDAGEALRRIFDDAAAFEATLRPRVAEQAFQQARRHARRGELGRALAAINRTLAYQPHHPGATTLLASIGRRRRAGVMAAVVLGTVAVAGVGYGVREALLATASRHAGGPAAAAPPAPAGGGPATAAAPEPAPRMKPTEPNTTPQSTPEKPKPARATRARERGERGHGASAPVAVATASAGEPQPAAPTPPAEPASEPARVPAPVVAATPPAVAPVLTPARLVLRAAQGFCSPSLDDHPPSIHPSYDGVAPGVHRIYCTLPLPPPRGTKVLVASYDLRPGAQPNLVIVPGPDGRPALGRPQ